MNLQERLFTVGQCLPKSCTTNDVNLILKLDQRLSSINQRKLVNNLTELKSSNEIKIIEVRNIPGDYSLIMDHKFYMLR